MNEELPIKQSKNGQELPFKLGNFLVNLIYMNSKNDPQSKVFCSLEQLNIELLSKPLINSQQQQQKKLNQASPYPRL